MIKGHLKFFILKILSNEPMSGYSIMKHIKQGTGCWKPSTGSVYPLLASMQKSGLLSVREDARRKVYSLTKQGNEKLESMMDDEKEVIDNFLEGIKLFYILFKDDEDMIKKVTEELDRIQ